MLLTLVIVYLLVTIAIGLMAAKRVQNSADFAIAGRHLPMAMIVTTTFATWFGSETVLGIPAKFVNGGLHGVVEDPFGAGFCLIFVGLFFAAKLYRMTLLTISDYYRERYGRSIEVVCSIIIMISYLDNLPSQKLHECNHILRNPDRVVIVFIGHRAPSSLMPTQKFLKGCSGFIPIKRTLLMRNNHEDIATLFYQSIPLFERLDRIWKMLDDMGAHNEILTFIRKRNSISWSHDIHGKRRTSEFPL